MGKNESTGLFEREVNIRDYIGSFADKLHNGTEFIINKKFQSGLQ
jgi:hypothetical protein